MGPIRRTNSNRLASGCFITYTTMFPLAIHLDTVDRENHRGATPSIDSTLECSARLRTTTDLQYS